LTLLAQSRELSRRRLVLNLGYRGSRPDRMYHLLVGGIVAVELCGTAGLAMYVYRQNRQTSGLSVVLPAVILICVYALAGPAILLAEGSRGSLTHVERVLETLPLARPTVRRILWLPPVLTSTVLMSLILPPAVASLVASNIPFTSALLSVTSAAATSAGFALLVLAASKLIVRGARWSAVQYPAALIASLIGAIYSLSSVVRLDDAPTPTDYVLGFPLVFDEILRRNAVPIGLGIATTVLGVTFSIVSLMVIFRTPAEASRSDRLIGWRISSTPDLRMGEILYLIRNAGLVANLLASFVLNCATVVLLMSLDRAQGRQLVGPVLSALPFMAGLPVRMTRGVYRRVWPQPELAGASLSSWTSRLCLAEVVFFLFGISPGLAVLARADLLRAVDGSVVAISAIGCAAVGIGLSWAIPSTTDDATSQVVAAWIYVVLASLTLLVLNNLAEWHTLAALAVSMTLLALSVLISRMVERSRWQPGVAVLRQDPGRRYNRGRMNDRIGEE